jgi:hypothetical protein
MKWEQLSPEQMDKEAEEAEKVLRSMPHTTTIPIARWWKEHYIKAGHKRLGRLMVSLAKETATLPKDQWTTEEDVSESKKGGKKK